MGLGSRLLWLSVILFTPVSQGAGTFSLCRRFLAEKTLAERLALLHGGQALAPTPKSRLGRYLAESQALTFRYRFPADPSGKTLGEEKLVVLVSPQSFPKFKEQFGHTYPSVLEHLHTPRQGTLIVRWGDWTTSGSNTYGQLNFNDEWRFPKAGSLGIMLQLSDAEAGRVATYFEMTAIGDVDSIELRNPATIAGLGYPKDEYLDNCTAWFGHLPAGDLRISRVTSPANRDGAPATWGRARTSTLRSYPDGSLPEYTDRQRDLIRQVWSPCMHQPLFELLGIPLKLANHTNPGWVALTLTGLIGNDRVPFVVLYTDDHTKLPDVNFRPQISPVGP